MALHGPLPDVEIPQVTLYDLLFTGLTPDELDRVGVFHDATGQELTYRQIRNDVDHVSAWFTARGVGPGDAVLLMMPDCPEYITAFHGIARSGAASSPVNVQYTAYEVAYQVRATGATWVVVHASLLAPVAEGAAMVGLSPDHLVVVGEPATEPPDVPTDAYMGFVPYADVLSCTDPLPPQDVADPARHVACLPMSSGIGGLQKPVMLSHTNLVANVVQFFPVLDQLGIQHTLVAFLPFSHVYALTDTMNYALAKRFPLLTMPSFDPVAYLRLVQDHRATLLYVVPPVAALLAKHSMVDQYDMSSVEVIISGAAPLEQSLGEALAERFGAHVLQGYGMTELSPVSHVMQPQMEGVRFESIGPAMPNVRFRVVDPRTHADVEVPATGESEPGELWCAGPSVMMGYLDDPEATAAILDQDGFLHTGDLVRVDARGIVRIVGRTKELIKNRGFQVPPAELEAVICSHPAVADVGVYGVPLPNAGRDEAPYALVQLTAGATLSAPDLVKYVSARVAPFKKLRSVTFVDKVPRSPEGVLLRKALPLLDKKARAAR